MLVDGFAGSRQNRRQSKVRYAPYDFSPLYSGPFSLDRTKISSALVKDGETLTIAFGDKYIPTSSQNQAKYDEAGLDGASLTSIARFSNPGSEPENSNVNPSFPYDAESDTSMFKFGSSRGADCCFAFLGGNVRWVSYDTDPKVLIHMSVIGDGEPVTD